MRDDGDPLAAMFACVSAERRGQFDHPMRSIKAYADAALQAISRSAMSGMTRLTAS